MNRLAIALLLIAPAAVQARTFNDPACPVTFDMPRGWAVEVDKTNEKKVCEIAMEPRNREKLLEKDGGVWLHGVSIEIVKGDLDAAISDDGSFELQEGSWVILGRQGIASPASETSTTGCHTQGT